MAEWQESTISYWHSEVTYVFLTTTSSGWVNIDCCPLVLLPPQGPSGGSLRWRYGCMKADVHFLKQCILEFSITQSEISQKLLTKFPEWSLMGLNCIWMKRGTYNSYSFTLGQKVISHNYENQNKHPIPWHVTALRPILVTDIFNSFLGVQ